MWLPAATVIAGSFADSDEGKQIDTALKGYFAAAPNKRTDLAFAPELDPLLLSHPQEIRDMAWKAYRSGWERDAWKPEVDTKQVSHKHLVMPYTVRKVGTMPEAGWGVFIPMHGGGGAPKHINNRSWHHMQVRYKDHVQHGGYLYVTPRAPSDGWNGFYNDDALALTDRLIRQLQMFYDVNPNRVYLAGYSHGGYGAFYQGTHLADRFAHIHASSAAPTEYDASGLNLRNTHFTFMIDDSDVKHDRKQRCVWFDEWIKNQRGDRDDIYPVKMEMMKGFGLGRLPDHYKLKEMLQHVRTPLPSHISWFAWPSVHYMNWLYAPAPRKSFVEAECGDNRVTLTTKTIDEVDVLLDERLVDLAKPVTVSMNGEEQTVECKPSLLTLCETLAARGDPEYVFTVRIPLKAASQ